MPEQQNDSKTDNITAPHASELAEQDKIPEGVPDGEFLEKWQDETEFGENISPEVESEALSPDLKDEFPDLEAESPDLETELPDREAESPDFEAKLLDLEDQLAESRDQLLRKAAEFENFRKRTTQEKQKAIEYANRSLLEDIIPIIDDFERAILSAESSEELAGLPAGKAILEGISMIEKRLVSRLEAKWGLKRFDSLGENFDPSFHEAVLMEKSPDIEEPLVQEEFVKGYMLKDLVFKPKKSAG